MNKKGTLTIYIYFFLISVMLIFTASVIIPFGINFNTAMFSAGETILTSAEETAEEIDDTEVRESITTAITDAKESTTENVSVLSNMYQYSWAWIIILLGIILFIMARQTVESNKQNNFI